MRKWKKGRKCGGIAINGDGRGSGDLRTNPEISILCSLYKDGINASADDYNNIGDHLTFAEDFRHNPFLPHQSFFCNDMGSGYTNHNMHISLSIDILAKISPVGTSCTGTSSDR